MAPSCSSLPGLLAPVCFCLWWATVSSTTTAATARNHHTVIQPSTIASAPLTTTAFGPSKVNGQQHWMPPKTLSRLSPLPLVRHDAFASRSAAETSLWVQGPSLWSIALVSAISYIVLHPTFQLKQKPSSSLLAPLEGYGAAEPRMAMASVAGQPPNPFQEEWFLVPAEGDDGDVLSFLDLNAGCVIVLGSDVTAGATFTKPTWILSGKVADTHCRFDYWDDAYWLEDLGSEQGTYVNDSRLEPFQPYRVCVGDQISLGLDFPDADFEVLRKR